MGSHGLIDAAEQPLLQQGFQVRWRIRQQAADGNDAVTAPNPDLFGTIVYKGQ
jgi:hypothetical protein